MIEYPNHQVVWSDGLLLLPQHFQQQERFFLHCVYAKAKMLHQQHFGFCRVEIDRNALRRGFFALTSASGIFPDGTHFDLPHYGGLPLPLHLTQRHERSTIMLSMPPQGVEFVGEDHALSLTPMMPPKFSDGQPRFIAEEIALPDCYDPEADLQLVPVASLKPMLCLEETLPAGHIAMPVAHISKVGEKGEVELVPDFVPPLLDLSGSEWLCGEVQSILELIAHRADWQMSRLNQPQTTALLETSDFLLLQSLLRQETALRFELGLSPISPLKVYQHLLTLLSELLAIQSPPSRSPLVCVWQSMRPGELYLPLLQQLRDLLSMMRERLALELSFRQTEDGLFVCTQHLPVIGANDRIILAVHAQVPEDWLWQRFNDQAVVCATDRLVHRVRLQMPGIPLRHLPTTPPELPLQGGWHYFELDRSDSQWADLVSTRSIGVHAAGNWPGLTLRGWMLQARVGQRETR